MSQFIDCKRLRVEIWTTLGEDRRRQFLAHLHPRDESNTSEESDVPISARGLFNEALGRTTIEELCKDPDSVLQTLIAHFDEYMQELVGLPTT